MLKVPVNVALTKFLSRLAAGDKPPPYGLGGEQIVLVHMKC